MRRTLFILVVVAIVSPLSAEPSPYAGMASRTIKALSDEQIRQYTEGAGMGFAIAAELNGYPGPKHILELADALKLTAEQRVQVQEIFDRMQRAAVGAGTELVKLEKELDASFREERIDDDSLAKLTSAIAALQGRLREVHLAAHLEARPVLTRHQLHEYARLRGYANGSGHAHHKH